MTQDISALLAELKSLHEKATEGPWFKGYWSDQCHKQHFPHPGPDTHNDPCVYTPYLSKIGGYIAAGTTDNQQMVIDIHYDELQVKDTDRNFIVALHNAFPALVAAIEAAREDAEILNWAETHPESAMKELVAWWTTCGPGAREIRFEFRNILRAEINRAREAG